ncbi:MAG: PKD domain-containing protein [Propionibacteriaceae bacterium]|nr:PKD domain-containing protein [Propionibacteriaceae bacterium]
MMFVRKTFLLLVLIILSTMILNHCKKAIHTALDDSTLVVTVNPASISLGGEAIVRVVGYKPNGAPLHDGTVIFFSTDLGSIESQIKTVDGVAESLFRATGSKSGVANIKVTSGNAVATPDSITISVGANALATLAISADPPTLPRGGGVSTIRVTAFDESKNPMPGISVTLNSTNGSLAGGGAVLTTGENGQVTDKLNTTQSAEVTATSGDMTASLTIEVSTDEPPTAAFTASPSSPVVGERVYFNGSESTDSDGVIVAYEWDFGDGRTASGSMVENKYKAVGTYTVVLTVRDNAGNKGSASQTVNVSQGNLPTASFVSSPQNPGVGDAVYFNGSASSDADGTIVGYAWDFGDGNTDTGMTVNHSYAAEGSYTVTLVVTDNDGNTGNSSQTVSVGDSNQGPGASFVYSPSGAQVNESINFNASASSDPDGTIVSYDWDFGDNSTGTGMTTSHSYTSPGTYTVVLTVTDDDGKTGTTNQGVTVGDNEAPTAAFSTSPTSPVVNETIYFNGGLSTDADGSIVSYAWDFGDNNTDAGVNVTHSYATAGSYTVYLTVTDDGGATDTTTKLVTVSAAQALNASFVVSPTSPGVDDSVSFNASDSSSPYGNITAYEWDFGDGGTGTGVSTVHSYSAAGSYRVYLKITDEKGNTGSTTKDVTVTAGSDPVPSFVYSPASPNIGDTIYFNASDSSDGDGSITAYSWDFGDGATDTGVTVSHVFAAYGEYNVTLTVTDDDNNTATTTQKVTVADNIDPTAAFTVSGTGLSVSFDGTGSVDNESGIASYSWNFGDGDTGSGAVVSHNYTASGTYSVILTVTDNAGNTATSAQSVTVPL